jgi:hypothetical protein
VSKEKVEHLRYSVFGSLTHNFGIITDDFGIITDFVAPEIQTTSSRHLVAADFQVYTRAVLWLFGQDREESSKIRDHGNDE